jgi:hypothetical protein
MFSIRIVFHARAIQILPEHNSAENTYPGLNKPGWMSFLKGFN